MDKIVYMAAAPGFVPSGKRSQSTVDVSNNDKEELLEIPSQVSVNLGNEEEDKSESELYALQARLAAEQDIMVAERSKAER